ncbi:MAG: DUF488 domain-containing protein [Methanobacterium sp.]|jgi:uncharacterized protein YeaO (DUF488 family)
MIKIKSLYQPLEKGDGYRILIDNSSPPNVSNETTQLDLWLKGIAPSNNLIKWFVNNHNKWFEYKKKYLEELKNKKTLLKLINDNEKKYGTVTLLYTTKDEKRNNAQILKNKLQGYKTIHTSISRTHG